MVYGPPIRTLRNLATPVESVTAYSSTFRPERDLPYKRNFTLSTNPSSEVLVTSKAPRLSTLLKVTVEVCPPTMVTCCEVWGV